TAAVADQRGFVRHRKITAGSDEERAAPHRRIDDAQLQNLRRRSPAHERRERAADEIFCDWLRRVESPGCLAHARAGAKRDGTRIDGRLIVEQRLVDGAELLDAEI